MVDNIAEVEGQQTGGRVVIDQIKSIGRRSEREIRTVVQVNRAGGGRFQPGAKSCAGEACAKVERADFGCGVKDGLNHTQRQLVTQRQSRIGPFGDGHCQAVAQHFANRQRARVAFERIGLAGRQNGLHHRNRIGGELRRVAGAVIIDKPRAVTLVGIAPADAGPGDCSGIIHRLRWGNGIKDGGGIGDGDAVTDGNDANGDIHQIARAGGVVIRKSAGAAGEGGAGRTRRQRKHARQGVGQLRVVGRGRAGIGQHNLIIDRAARVHFGGEGSHVFGNR